MAVNHPAEMINGHNVATHRDPDVLNDPRGLAVEEINGERLDVRLTHRKPRQKQAAQLFLGLEVGRIVCLGPGRAPRQVLVYLIPYGRPGVGREGRGASWGRGWKGREEARVVARTPMGGRGWGGKRCELWPERWRLPQERLCGN
jgi:hypothetical protein